MFRISKEMFCAFGYYSDGSLNALILAPFALAKFNLRKELERGGILWKAISLHFGELCAFPIMTKCWFTLGSVSGLFLLELCDIIDNQFYLIKQ